MNRFRCSDLVFTPSISTNRMDNVVVNVLISIHVSHLTLLMSCTYSKDLKCGPVIISEKNLQYSFIFWNLKEWKQKNTRYLSQKLFLYKVGFQTKLLLYLFLYFTYNGFNGCKCIADNYKFVIMEMTNIIFNCFQRSSLTHLGNWPEGP